MQVGFGGAEDASHSNGDSRNNKLEVSNQVSAPSEALDERIPSSIREDVREPTEPYGIVGIGEIFRYLCSLLDSGVITGQRIRAIDEDVPLFALGLINTAVELGGNSFSLHTELLAIIQENLFESIMQLALPSKNPLILSMVCSVVLNLYHHLRSHLKLQLESFFSCIIIRLAQGKHGASYQQQEVAMEALVDFCRQPSFMYEMYVNFDCDISCSNLFESYESACPQEVSLILSVWKKILKDLSLDISESVDLSVEKLCQSLFNSRRKSAKHL